MAAAQLVTSLVCLLNLGALAGGDELPTADGSYVLSVKFEAAPCDAASAYLWLLRVPSGCNPSATGAAGREGQGRVETCEAVGADFVYKTSWYTNSTCESATFVDTTNQETPSSSCSLNNKGQAEKHYCATRNLPEALNILNGQQRTIWYGWHRDAACSTPADFYTLYKEGVCVPNDQATTSELFAVAAAGVRKVAYDGAACAGNATETLEVAHGFCFQATADQWVKVEGYWPDADTTSLATTSLATTSLATTSLATTSLATTSLAKALAPLSALLPVLVLH